MKTFLTRRKVYFRLGDGISTKFKFTGGSPLVSVLGPLMLLLFAVIQKQATHASPIRDNQFIPVEVIIICIQHIINIAGEENAGRFLGGGRR